MDMSDTPPPRKKRRWLLWALGAVVVLVLAAGLVLPSLIDVERFRPQIERVLQDSTGWDAELGDIELSLFRGALAVSPASLTAIGGDTSKIEIGRIDVKVDLLPLLRNGLGRRLHLQRCFLFGCFQIRLDHLGGY